MDILSIDLFSTDFLVDVARWTAIADGVLLVLTIVAFVAKWGFRFRLIGATAFTAVLAIGIFGLSLSLFARPTIEGATAYKRVYDSGGAEVVIAVDPDLDRDRLTATLKQAAIDLYSPGRIGPKPEMTVYARSLDHSQTGVSKLVYRAKLVRSLNVKLDPNPAIEFFR